jgi:1-deoxy-D-xylulose-5-phosphate synthase
MAEADLRVVGITPAMREGSGMVEYSRRFPTRYFDVAIAEQHAVTLAAGMACDGLRPVVAIYSSFLQRAYDQLIHDVALQNLPVTFALDRAGLVGGDGATHQGSFDLSFLRCIPNLTIMAPANENECRQMLYTAVQLGSPAVVRYPRGQGTGVAIERAMQTLPIGKAEAVREGRSGLAILAWGPMVGFCEPVAKQLDATLINMRFIKPLDEALLLKLAEKHTAFITVEENTIAGGAGSAVAEFLNAHGIHHPLLHIGIPDQFIEHGSRQDCLVSAGLDIQSITHTITQWWPAPAQVASN